MHQLQIIVYQRIHLLFFFYIRIVGKFCEMGQM